MATVSTQFTALTTVGGLLPADFLLRVAEGRGLPHAAPADYRVVGTRGVTEAAERHWSYLKEAWRGIRKAGLKLDKDLGPDEALSDPSGRARDEWLLPLFDELGFGGLPSVPGGGILADDGHTLFAVTHHWGQVPIHLVSWATDIDDRSAYSLTQECLNRSEKHLWGIVSNGRKLRLLRDNSALSGPAYVEFDLAEIFEGELVADFVLLYRLLHATRFRTGADAPASTCVLETWRGEAIRMGVRALDQLRDGVETAIATLGTGFLAYRANELNPTALDVEEYHRAVLRLTYRLLFWFVAEERGVLHTEDSDAGARDRYREYFSSAKLREHARRRRGSRHVDLFRGVRFVLDGLGSEEGLEALGLPGLGGIFDQTEADKMLAGCELSNEALLTAVRSLAAVYDKGARRWRAIDYRHLDAEELGSVYESLLERVPRFVDGERRFELETLAGNERKTTGSYYTPSSLIERLLDTTLDPVIDAAQKKGGDDRDAILRELLALKVCDPACGSGHFLVAAARRIAKRVASVRHETPEPSVKQMREALREVIGRGIYGVDLNPIAVELAKVALWLEAMVPGKPLGFLDAHVKQGNALIGAFPALMADGIPDDAWTAIEGDDKVFARELKKRNKAQRAEDEAQQGLFGFGALEQAMSNAGLAVELRRIADATSSSLKAVHAQEARYKAWEASAEVAQRRLLADTWCAAFFWPKEKDAPFAPTEGVYRELGRGVQLPMDTEAEVRRLAEGYRFFHWHLEFPEVFEVPEHGVGIDEKTGWNGGFSTVVGNPPWERLKLQEQEFFSQRAKEIAEAANAAVRKRMIAALPETNRGLYTAFKNARREATGQSHFTKSSGRFPLTGTGDINTYSVFAETDQALTSPHGRTGVIVPTGIATDATTQHFFKDLVARRSLTALYDFENAEPIFPAVHRSFKFCILSTAGRELPEPEARFAFFLHNPVQLDDADRIFTLTPEEITLLNPNTGTCPVFRSSRDAELTLDIYRNVPILLRRGTLHGNPWGFAYTEVLHLAHAAAHLIETPGSLAHEDLAVYEAKMIHQFDHRWFTYQKEEKVNRQDPTATATPRYWIHQAIVNGRLSERWREDWMIGWRDICRSTDERTLIAAAVPRAALANTLPLAALSIPQQAGDFLAMVSTYVVDFVARQKVAGTHMTVNYLAQLPILPPATTQDVHHFITPRVLELTHTAYDMAPFARNLGDDGPPFVWDDDRRFVMRCELDSLFFHLYGIARDDVDYIMETFPIVKRKDVAAHGTYRTKDTILKYYDQMAAAGVTIDAPPVDGENFTSELTPPPGHGPRHPAQAE